MRYTRLTCVVILAALVIAPMAWSQRVPTQEDLDEAILKIRASMDSKQSGVRLFKSRLVQARRLLAGNPDQSLPMVTVLLNDSNAQIRLNAALVLAETAQRADTVNQALLDALERCLEDTNSAVAYWGLQGFVADSVPDEKRVEAIEASLDIKRPRLVRLTAARLAGDKKILSALPTLVAHLQRILPSYTFQVETLLTYEVEVDEFGYPLNPDMANPGYVGKGTAMRGMTRSRQIVSPLKGGAGSTGARRGSGSTGGGRPGGGRPPPDYGGGSRPGGGRPPPRYGGGSRPPSPTGRGPQTSRRTPATTRRSRSSDAYGERDYIRVEKRQLDPDKLGFQDIERLILDLQELPSVYELHEIGYIVEGLAKATSGEMPFGEDASFERMPPWALDRCVEAAVVWVDKNRAEFPNAPAPVSDAAKEEAKDTAAPVEKEAPEA